MWWIIGFFVLWIISVASGGSSKSNSYGNEKYSRKIKNRDDFISSTKLNKKGDFQSSSSRDAVSQTQKIDVKNKNTADKVGVEFASGDDFTNQNKLYNHDCREVGSDKLSEVVGDSCGHKDLEECRLLPFGDVSVSTSLSKINLSEDSSNGSCCDDITQNIFSDYTRSERRQFGILNEGLELNRAALAFHRNGVTSLWHMTHRDNVDSIVENGILSNSIAYGRVRPKDISDHKVQRWRERVDPFFNKKIHEYVPLYINPKNPMLFKRRSIQDELCLIEVSLSVLVTHTFIYTDGNAASRDTSFYDGIDKIDDMPWDVINSAYWSGYIDGKRKKCAEVLVYPTIESGYIKKIHCYSQDTLKYLKDNNIECTVTTNLFF